MKIVIIGNQARAAVNFWTPLITRLVKAGHEAVVLVPTHDSRGEPGDEAFWEQNLIGLGCRLVHYPLDRKGLNPFADLKTLLALRKILKAERPDRLFAYTIKPVIYGSFAAALAGAPEKEHRHVMITGLGYMFEGGSFFKRLLTRVASLLYRTAFSCVHTVFFQNSDDRELFDKLRIVPTGTKVRMTKGTGVDTERFLPVPHSGEDVFAGSVRFLFIGRLLEAKGLYELADAARLLKKKYSDIEVGLLGPLEAGRGGIPLATIREWEGEGILTWLGEAKDVRPHIAKSTVAVLPSWREGTPCSLMEAMSMAKPLVAADAPGSREVVRDGVNGFLAPVQDFQALANAMERFIIEPGLARSMGEKGRALALAEYDAQRVADGLMQAMNIPLP